MTEAGGAGQGKMGRPVKVYLCGSENNGWALDTDLRLTRESLLSIPETVTLTSLEDADVIHSVWEEPLFMLDQEVLAGKRVICHVCNDFMRLHENPVMIRAVDTVGLWVTMSEQAVKELKLLGYPYEYIPYSVDIEQFFPVDAATKKEIRSGHNIPEDVFVISNFMRDSFGHDLQTPKDQKGTELLLEVGRCLYRDGIPVHFLLAGPRRHWIREQLSRARLPFTFVGDEVEGDDLAINIQPAEVIADLYRASDVHLISSRWEGGPRSVLESAATKTPVLCTPVGIAPDILHSACVYSSVDEAVAKVKKHYNEQYLDSFLDGHYSRILAHHTVESNSTLFQRLYEQIEKVEPYSLSNRWVAQPSPQPTLIRRVENLVRHKLGMRSKERQLCISLWHKFVKPPYGGGNQFMMALQGAMERQGVNVVTNKLSSSVDAHVCNSCWFDHRKFEKKAGDFPIRMIHRIDGPVTLYRGEGRDVDEEIFRINSQFASATVFQSAYCFRKSYELGFNSVSPVIISNSVNRDIFNDTDRVKFDSGRKTRLISSAWSDNPRKGGAFLKWLDRVLDWDRFEYTFVGRVKETFDNINHIDAVPSEELADLLRAHDVFISVSMHEPCSNALLEALFCGLPALYRNDGGNPELVSFGGLPFENEHDVLEKLDRIVDNYQSFQNLIQLKMIDEIATRYINLAKRLSAWEA